MCFNPKTISVCRKSTNILESIKVPCGYCYECIMQHSKEWSYRIMDEAGLYEKNCFITLTYNDENLQSKSLVKSDYQKFLKRLRKKVGKVRYFGCGEYGSKNMRPHFHFIIFGWCPDDLVKWCFDNKGTQLYRSAMLEKLWQFGFSTVGEVTEQSALYCSKYLQKMQDYPFDFVKPFVTMSLKPGIGLGAFNAQSLKSDKLYRNGKYIKLPRYYLDQAEKSFGFVEEVQEIRENRLTMAELMEKTPEELKEKQEKILKLFARKVVKKT